MDIWAKLFGRRSNPPTPTPPTPTPPPPSPSAPFQDRPAVRRILYYLQHVVLRDGALMSHRPMAEVIASGRISEENARYFWAKSTSSAIFAGAIPASLLPRLVPTPPGDPARLMLEEGVRVLTSIPIQTRRRDDLTATVFLMPAPAYSVEAHFIGVVRRDSAPTETVRYFTLERVGDGSHPPWVCEWRAPHRHVNDRDELEPDLDAFAARILTRAQS
jgi:hypothetical protein